MLPGNRPIWLGDHSRSIMIIRKSQRFLWIINHGIMILRKSLVWEKEMKNAILDKVLVSVSHIGHHFLVFYRHNHRKLTKNDSETFVNLGWSRRFFKFLILKHDIFGKNHENPIYGIFSKNGHSRLKMKHSRIHHLHIGEAFWTWQSSKNV